MRRKILAACGIKFHAPMHRCVPTATLNHAAARRRTLVYAGPRAIRGGEGG